MHNYITNVIFVYVQSVDFIYTKNLTKIYSICGNMDYLYV